MLTAPSRVGDLCVQFKRESKNHVEQHLEEAGASLLLLEAIPQQLAERITRRLRIPVIGIGAGRQVDAQIMVMHDLLGITPPGIKIPKFVKNFLVRSDDGIRGAFAAYRQAVKEGSFPGPEHSYD